MKALIIISILAMLFTSCRVSRGCPAYDKTFWYRMGGSRPFLR
jgi:hypothetical protein